MPLNEFQRIELERIWGHPETGNNLSEKVDRMLKKTAQTSLKNIKYDSEKKDYFFVGINNMV